MCSCSTRRPAHARADVDRRDGRIRVRSVSFRNVPSFVLHAGIPLRVNGRDLRADVAFGGAFYAIVDSEAAGIPVHRSAAPRSAHRGHGHQACRRGRRPGRASAGARAGGNLRDDFHRSRVRRTGGSPQCDRVRGRGSRRSPCGTGTCAVMAVLSAMGLLQPEQTFTHESIIGSRFRAEWWEK